MSEERRIQVDTNRRAVVEGLSPMSLEPGNPDPMRWTLLRGQKVGRGYVAEIRYPDCTNYEGKKILVFQAASMESIVKQNQGMLDPHFTDDRKMVAPVARFEPTERGWELALLIAANL